MANNAQPISVSVTGARKDYSSLGMSIVTYSVSSWVYGDEHIAELDDADFRYLHEQLRDSGGNTPEFLIPWNWLWLYPTAIDSRAREYHKYLSETLSSPDCVSKSILWVTLNVPAEAAVVQRFLVRGDNIVQIEELTLISEQISRLASGPVLGAILSRMSISDIGALCSGATILTRLSSRTENSRVFVETKVVSSLVSMLWESSGISLQVVSDLLSTITFNYPHILFEYFQRDSGMGQIIDLLDTEPRRNNLKAMECVAKGIWYGVTMSKDVEIAVADKSSVGIALLNKLLVKGQGTETELIVAATLAFLSSRKQVPEFDSKINAIIESVVSDSTLDAKLDFCGSDFKKIIGLIGGKLLSGNEMITQLGCHLVIQKAVKVRREWNDESWFDRNGYKQSLVQRLTLTIFAGSELKEVTRAKAAEALLMVGGTERHYSDDMRTELEKEKIINGVNSKSLTLKIQKLNNFFIEANFDLTSRTVPGPFEDSFTRSLSQAFGEVMETLRIVNSEQKNLNEIHSQALNDVVSGMFEVKSLLKETESAGKRGELLLEEYAETIAEYETSRTDARVAELHAKPEFKALLEEPKLISSHLREINSHVIRLNVDKYASLVEAVGRIDSMMTSSNNNILHLKTALRKSKDIIEQLLDEIEAETTSSPVTP